jgi:phosphoglycerate dehydrogenase-like enzyme
MHIVFHGKNAAAFSDGFADLLGDGMDVAVLPDALDSAADREAFAAADVIIGTRFDASLPRPRQLMLFHVPGAGYDAVDLAALPLNAMVCNCFGHESAIAEYVMAVLLQRAIPLQDANTRLRAGDWTWSAANASMTHAELSGSTIGVLGFGHIGKAVAARAKAFGMTVHVANRGPVAMSDTVDRAFTLAQLPAFWGSLDTAVITLPLVPETAGIVGREAFSLMRPDAVLINVARGPVVDEQSLFDALSERRIGGAVIDTWYRYPAPGQTTGCLPSNLPFHELPNIVMTPHMSGWTTGTIRRRQRVMADNIRRRIANEPGINVVRQPA